MPFNTKITDTKAMTAKRIVSTLTMILVVVVALAENNYKVTSSSRLNVRRSPSVYGAVLGAFVRGQEIEVISVSNGWAKVKYKGTIGYVSGKYITPLPKQDVSVKAIEEPTKNEPEEKTQTIGFEFNNTSDSERSLSKNGDSEICTPLRIESSLSDAINLYLAVEGGVGWSNFIWSNGESYGTIAYSANILAQFYFEDKVSFIPKDWYSEIVFGYNKLGASNFDMNYIHLGLIPFGYRVPLNPLNFVIMAGVDLSYPLNSLSTSNYTWDAGFQFGIVGGVQVEWKQFAIGCNIIYDLTEVSPSCGETLNNIGVLGTISYKFGKFGHKK